MPPVSGEDFLSGMDNGRDGADHGAILALMMREETGNIGCFRTISDTFTKGFPDSRSGLKMGDLLANRAQISIFQHTGQSCGRGITRVPSSRALSGLKN